MIILRHLQVTSNLQNSLRRTQGFLGTIHLQDRKIVWDSVRKLACHSCEKSLHAVSDYRNSLLRCN